MLRATLGAKDAAFQIIYGAEVDCINQSICKNYDFKINSKFSDGDYLEIKTQYREIGHGQFFDNKAMKWWLQVSKCKNIVLDYFSLIWQTYLL